jgi:hypothetical protein
MKEHFISGYREAFDISEEMLLYYAYVQEIRILIRVCQNTGFFA